MDRLRSLATLALVSLAVLVASPGDGSADPTTTPAERAARELDAVRDNPLLLRDFLKRMPKGADLHTHLSGAIYAESHLRDAVEDELCIDIEAKAFAKAQPTIAGAQQLGPVCEANQVPAGDLAKNQPLYNALVDSFSMRGFVASEGVTGHDHFFGAFIRFGGNDPSHTGAWVDEIAGRAAVQNVQYVELMLAPPWNRLNTITKDIGWREDLTALREALVQKGLFEDIPAARSFLDEAEALRRSKEHCGEPDETAACKVDIRFQYQVFRNAPKALVFAQALFGFQLASVDPRVVAVNLVGAEDDIAAVADYDTHMRLLGYLRGVYPQVHLSLHAGELSLGLVPPEALCCHIRQAVEIAGAERLGHGVDVMYENEPQALLKELAAKKVLVEINLSSNDSILGVSGKNHPFPIYRKFGVPVALSTDDEGIERIDLTHEYVRAVDSYALSYADLKQLVRSALEHSFLPGASLWREGGSFVSPVSDCDSDPLGDSDPSPSCAAFLSSSDRAKQQWELERRFAAFESSF